MNEPVPKGWRWRVANSPIAIKIVRGAVWKGVGGQLCAFGWLPVPRGGDDDDDEEEGFNANTRK
jgi:hypothetical protein